MSATAHQHGRPVELPDDVGLGEEELGLFASLKEVWEDNDKSAMRLFGAILFWFVGYNAIEAFFTLYAKNYLEMTAADGTRLLGHLSLFFVLSALIAGFVGSKLGRRNTILSGIFILGSIFVSLYLLPPSSLTPVLTVLPVLGNVPVISLFLMGAGVAWALININSLPMVVDMVDDSRIGTYTGLYYLFATMAAIFGPNVNGWIIQLTDNNYNSIMLVAPTFMFLAFLMMLGVTRGEAKPANANK